MKDVEQEEQRKKKKKQRTRVERLFSFQAKSNNKVNIKLFCDFAQLQTPLFIVFFFFSPSAGKSPHTNKTLICVPMKTKGIIPLNIACVCVSVCMYVCECVQGWLAVAAFCGCVTLWLLGYVPLFLFYKSSFLFAVLFCCFNFFCSYAASCILVQLSVCGCITM